MTLYLHFCGKSQYNNVPLGKYSVARLLLLQIMNGTFCYPSHLTVPTTLLNCPISSLVACTILVQFSYTIQHGTIIRLDRTSKTHSNCNADWKLLCCVSEEGHFEIPNCFSARQMQRGRRSRVNYFSPIGSGICITVSRSRH